jgi:hypothetical protein
MGRHEIAGGWFDGSVRFGRRRRFYPRGGRVSNLHGMDEQGEKPVVKGSFESWLVGFISGLNVSWERDMIGGGDFDSIVAWMDTRRRATPSDRIGIAALDLGMELAKRARP